MRQAPHEAVQEHGELTLKPVAPCQNSFRLAEKIQEYCACFRPHGLGLATGMCQPYLCPTQHHVWAVGMLITGDCSSDGCAKRHCCITLLFTQGNSLLVAEAGSVVAGLKVAELTGDTQLSKKKLSETQMIVTTAEEWDVITRKGGDVIMAATVRLLIIGEVKHFCAPGLSVFAISVLASDIASDSVYPYSSCLFRVKPSLSAMCTLKQAAYLLCHDSKKIQAQLHWPLTHESGSAPAFYSTCMPCYLGRC